MNMATIDVFLCLWQFYKNTEIQMQSICLGRLLIKKIKMLEGKGVYIKDVVIDCVSLDEIEYSIKRLNASYIKNS